MQYYLKSVAQCHLETGFLSMFHGICHGCFYKHLEIESIKLRKGVRRDENS